MSLFLVVVVVVVVGVLRREKKCRNHLRQFRTLSGSHVSAIGSSRIRRRKGSPVRVSALFLALGKRSRMDHPGHSCWNRRKL